MRTAVIGAGAVGSLISYILDAGGMEVVLYERREERISEIRENGVRLQGRIEGGRGIEIKGVGEPEAPFDVIILAAPAGDAAELIRPVSPFVHRDTRYLSMQEGGTVEGLAEVVGGERAGAIIAGVSAVESASGAVEVEECRYLTIGAYVHGKDPYLTRFARALSDVAPQGAVLTDRLAVEVWGRLVSAAAVSALCGLAGAPPAEISEREDMDALCRDAADECRRIAGLESQELPPTGSPWEEAAWRKLKPPMLLALEAGMGTEIEFLSGYIVRHARSSGAAAPIHSAMYSLVKEMESGKLRPGEKALKELRRRIEEEKGMPLL